MINKDIRPGVADELRQQAEERATGKAAPQPKQLESLSPEEMQQVLHELQVHQIELEIQNEELQRAQVELDAIRARYFDLYDLAPVGYCTLSDKGMIMETNLTAATLLGVPRGSMIGQPMSRFVLAEDRDIYYRHRQQLFAKMAPQVCQLRLLRSANSPFWARLEATIAQENESGPPVCRVVFSDITESKRADAARAKNKRVEAALAESKQVAAALAESELKYRTLADSGQALIWTAGLDRQCDYLNQPWLDFTGRTLEQERGQGWLEGVHPVDRDRCLQTYVAAFDQREKFSMDYRLRHASGDYRWVQDNGTPRFDSAGDFLGYIGHCLDITERKQAEEEREKLQAQLIQAQKLEAVGRLAGGIAHDFNNMLGIILGYAEIVQKKLDPIQPLYTYLDHIREAAERSATLTGQLLAFARKQIVTPRILDLNISLEGMVRMLQRLIGENINLVWSCSPDLWPIKIDPSQLDQILANLCVNSRDAIAGVGTVTVETKNVTLDAAACAGHLDFKPGEYVALVVSDDGCGLDEETQAKLFEPFFTTKETGKGTGLGLATVYGVVKQNNGFINVSSELGFGTTFTIYLPRHHHKAELLQQEEKQPVLEGNETILLAEDEAAILEVTTIMLQNQGYTVLAAATPGEAIELAVKHAGAIHLLMTDVIMPEMNGSDLARRLLSFYPGLKQLFMSGYTADIIAHHGVLNEGVNFIRKPFLIKELASKVREVLDQE